MNNLSRGVKLLLCIITGLIGFLVTPVIGIALQQSLGFKIPGIIFIWLICGVAGAFIKGIWQYQPEREYNPGDNSCRETHEQKIDKSSMPMFKDYYSILEIGMKATQVDIKTAFRKQALKWHPDSNPGLDTTSKMQDINEAKFILFDVDARERYAIEYFRFKEYQNQKEKQQRQQERQKATQYEKSWNHCPDQPQGNNDNIDFQSDDDILNRWMSNAKKQASDLVKETIEDIRGMTKTGVGAALEKIKSQIFSLLILTVIVLTIVLTIALLIKFFKT